MIDKQRVIAAHTCTNTYKLLTSDVVVLNVPVNPERTACHLMEASKPIDPVALAGSCHLSRSGPAVENGDGGFQPPFSGKYVFDRIIPLPDDFSCSSTAFRLSDFIKAYHHTNKLSKPECTACCLMEAPDPLDSVALAGCCHRRRSGPAVELGDGVFQPSTSEGLQEHCILPSPDDIGCRHGEPSECSTPCIDDISNGLSPIPERTAYCVMEAPSPLDPVVLAGSSRLSRSGPVVESGDGVFQPPDTGKYAFNRTVPLPDVPACSSSATRHSDDLHQNLRIYYQNVRGLRTKIDDFYLAVGEKEYDVIVLTETWLDECIFSSQLFGNNFSVFRTDRQPLNSKKIEEVEFS